MINFAKLMALIALCVISVLAVTEYSMHERISSGLPVLVVIVLCGLVISVYMRRLEKQSAVRGEQRRKMTEQWSFKDQ